MSSYVKKNKKNLIWAAPSSRHLQLLYSILIQIVKFKRDRETCLTARLDMKVVTKSTEKPH